MPKAIEKDPVRVMAEMNRRDGRPLDTSVSRETRGKSLPIRVFAGVVATGLAVVWGLSGGEAPKIERDDPHQEDSSVPIGPVSDELSTEGKRAEAMRLLIDGNTRGHDQLMDEATEDQFESSDNS